MKGLLAWLRSRDPNGRALRRAIRPTVVIPIVFAIGSQVIGDAQLATFAAFGSFALLIFVDFRGNRRARINSYLLLGITGAVFITLGTLVRTPPWLAVVSMAVVAFLVLYAGAVSSVIAAAGRAALLTFILPVMIPAPISALPMRLAGWGIALAVAVPVAVFVWPPDEVNVLRKSTVEMCRALAGMLRLERPAPGEPDPMVAAARANTKLRTAFRASTSRPVALTTGSRLLVRLVEELEWLASIVTVACADAPEQWPEPGRQLRRAAAVVMNASATVIDHSGGGPTPEAQQQLADSLTRLDETRRAVSDEAAAALRAASRVGAVADASGAVSDTGRAVVDTGGALAAPGDVTAGEFDRPLYAAHELGYAVSLTGRTAAAIGAADSRGWFARVMGRAPTAGVLGEAEAAERIAASHLHWGSVWLQNSIRGAAGLAFAVLLARVSGQQEGFWIVLGALSVLRSNALTTGATVVRALLGTVVGFIIGGLIVGAIGTDPAVLWSLLPVAVLVAAFAPDAISFAAGQAAFTVVVIILFNIIAPAGWRLGVLRVEDVAIGCGAALVAGGLFWPRGAGQALGMALGDAYRSSADYLHQSVEYVTGSRLTTPDLYGEAYAAAVRLDDALRQYLAEQGAKRVPLEDVTALANGASRVRLAGSAVSRLLASYPAPEPLIDDAYLERPVGVLRGRSDDLTSWYVHLGDVLSGTSATVPSLNTSRSDVSFLDVVLPAVDKCGDEDRAVRAERLLWAGQYVGDVGAARSDLIRPAGLVRESRVKPWWHL
jgi:uncharacterized membrane protein YccC